ncbi:MAG: hypothetical protein IJ607_06920 [Bacteroidaceae bacterium]|nr:hypothetical protein [Bacteroidaceae bacterium]
MNTMNVRDFRNNMASMLDLADNGEKVIIQRKSKKYLVIPLSNDDMIISPELERKIEEAREEYKSGKEIIFSNAKEAANWINEL